MNTEIKTLIADRNLNALAALTGGEVCPQGGLTIPGFGRVSWDAQDPQNEGWVVESLDYNGGLDGQPEPYEADELASALAEVVEMTK